MSILAHAQDLLDLADNLGVDRFYVVGHSYGGRIAQRVAEAAPTRTMGLGLISTWHGPVDSVMASSFRSRIRLLRAVIPALRWIPRFCPSNYTYAFLHSPALENSQELEACLAGPASRSPKLQGKVAVLHAKQDYTVPVSLGREAARIFDAEYTEIEGFIHQLPSARPDATAAFILRLVHDARDATKRDGNGIPLRGGS